MPKVDKGYENKYGVKNPRDSMTGGPGVMKSKKTKEDYLDEVYGRNRPSLMGKRKKILDEL